jgi:hypothetical protein
MLRRFLEIGVASMLFVATTPVPPGTNGCGWSSLDDVIVTMATGNAYVTIHTATYPGGVIRGQIEID